MDCGLNLVELAKQTTILFGRDYKMSNNDLKCSKCNTHHHPIECPKEVSDKPKINHKEWLLCILYGLHYPCIKKGCNCEKTIKNAMRYLKRNVIGKQKQKDFL